MSLFGKVLVVINLLIAGAFVYLATQDWKGRQTINGAGLRHILLLAGLPLEGPANLAEETPFKVEGPGGVPTKTVSKKLIEKYFQDNAGGGDASNPNTLATNAAVPSQVAEVSRVKSKIEEILTRTERPEEKIALLKGWLLYQVESMDERIEVLALVSPEKEDAEDGKPKIRPKTEAELARDAEELQRRLMARFEGVIAAPKPIDATVSTPLTDADLAEADTEAKKAKLIESRLAKVTESRVAPLDEGQRRAKLAHLLVHLSPEAGWQKRVVAVVGLRRYVSAIETQTRRFREMSLQLEQLLVADQENYFDQIAGRPESGRSPERRGLIQGAEDATRVANRMASIKAKWVAQAIKDQDLVSQRETQLTELRNQLIKIKTEVDAMLARQSRIEAGLFEIQREVAITLDEVYKLEAELQSREKKLAGGK
jgi:hypothetical protein